MVDAGRVEGEANADLDLAEAYVNTITPPALQKARDREKVTHVMLMNAETLSRLARP